LLPDVKEGSINERDLIRAESERGICRVICFSPRHDLTLSNMLQSEVERVIEVWREQYLELGAVPWIKHVEIFENRGTLMGASNPHPHCQVWANQTVPNLPLREQQALVEFSAAHSACMLCEYANLEEQHAARIVCSNDGFIALVPFWAVWPFEVLLLSRRHLPSFAAFDSEGVSALADILRRITARYDNVFGAPFPYSMGFHQAPTDGEQHTEWHFHAHFYPPLLRSATVRKFMVGYEMLASPQRDITPESAAERLRSVREMPLNPRS
jgi:UDPglucose--hexose-1-phosphate uridylyltransferase